MHLDSVCVSWGKKVGFKLHRRKKKGEWNEEKARERKGR